MSTCRHSVARFGEISPPCKIKKSWAIPQSFILYLAKCSTFFGKFGMPLGKFSVL